MAAALAAGGCGGSGDGASNAVGTATSTTTLAGAATPEFVASEVKVEAENINFPQKDYTTQAGEVTVGYVNEDEILHTLELETAGGAAVAGWRRLEVRERGSVDVTTVTLSPGPYVLYCVLPGHRPNGMEAVLTVEG